MFSVPSATGFLNGIIAENSVHFGVKHGAVFASELMWPGSPACLVLLPWRRCRAAMIELV
jgi:hypothetical protein